MRQAKHRIANMSRSSISCACGDWILELDTSVTLHSGDRANYLLDAWLRHKAETEDKAQVRKARASHPVGE